MKGKKNHTHRIFQTMHEKTLRPFSFAYLHSFLNNINKKWQTALPNSLAENKLSVRIQTRSIPSTPPGDHKHPTSLWVSQRASCHRFQLRKQHKAPLWADKTGTNRLLPMSKPQSHYAAQLGKNQETPPEILLKYSDHHTHIMPQEQFTTMAPHLWVKNSIRSWCEM